MARKQTDLYELADQLAGLWNTRQEHGFSERLWTMGSLIQKSVSGPSAQDAALSWIVK